MASHGQWTGICQPDFPQLEWQRRAPSEPCDLRRGVRYQDTHGPNLWPRILFAAGLREVSARLIKWRHRCNSLISGRSHLLKELIPVVRLQYLISGEVVRPINRTHAILAARLINLFLNQLVADIPDFLTASSLASISGTIPYLTAIT